MCSKLSSGSYGNREDDYSGLCPKKQKHDNNNNGKRKIPRRGPGVAELEKIRLEEQHASPAALLPPPPEKSLSAILPTTTNKTGPVYQFPSYLTTGSFPDDFIPPAPVFQNKHDSPLHYLPSMNLPNPGFYQFIDPPSNQTSCLDNNVSQFRHQEKIVSAKRPWSFIAETTKCSVGPTIKIPRDGKQIRSLDLRLKCDDDQDSVITIRNPITIDSPSTTTTHTPIFPNFPLDFPNFIQKEGFDHEFLPRRSGTKLSLNKIPFYSFLEPSNEHTIRPQDRSFSFKTQRYDTLIDHGIDLRLRL